MKILTVDHAGLLQGAGVPAALAADGHEVRPVLDGIQGLREARAWSPDVVLASVHQPRMDGLALTAALHALHGAAAPAVVLLGPDADLHARTRGRELGITAYLPLPLQLASLLQVLSRVERAALGTGVLHRRGESARPRRKAS